MSREEEQRELLNYLAEYESESSRLAQRLSDLDALIAEATERLEGIREENMHDLLLRRLASSNVAFTILPDGVALAPLPGGEIEFAKIEDAIADPTNASYAEVLTYLGEPQPWEVIL